MGYDIVGDYGLQQDSQATAADPKSSGYGSLARRTDGATIAGQQQIYNGAQKQQDANRLDTSNPFSSVTFGPDGQVSQQFSGGLGQAFNGLNQQAAGLGQGMDWSQFGQMGNGDQARNQAIDAAYGQASSRLDPMWNQREEQARTRLVNQGLDPNSEAARNEMGQLGNQRTDAYNQAMFSAIGQGREAGDSVFRNNMGARQQAISEALKARGMPLEEMGQLQGFLSGQPGYNQDNTSFMAGLQSGNMGVQGVQNQTALNQQNFNQRMAMLTGSNDQAAGAAQGGMSALSSAAAFAPLLMASDERLKTDIRRGPDVIPGVPSATWRWRGNGEEASGVIAQDLRKVRPDLVHEREDGMLLVNYGGLRGDK